MKRHLLFTLLLGLLAAPLWAQPGNTVVVDNLIRKTNAEIQDLQRRGRTIGRVEMGIITKDTISFSPRDMYANEYEIVAFADDLEIRDIDIYLYEIIDDEWVLGRLNKSDHPEGRIVFVPAEKRRHIIVVRGHGFATDPPTGHFSLIIAYTVMSDD